MWLIALFVCRHQKEEVMWVDDVTYLTERHLASLRPAHGTIFPARHARQKPPENHADI